MTEAVAEAIKEEPVVTEAAATTEQAATTATTEQAATEGTTEAAVEKPAIPDNWRDLITGDNEDVAKLINRYGTPANVGKALLDKERQIREGKSGKLEKPDPKDEKAVAEWRKAIGIPDAPEGYKLPDDVLKGMSDEDKPILAQFTEFAHKKGLTPDAVAGAAEWYVESQTAALEQQKAKDTEDAEKCGDVLSGEWSRAEFKGNRVLATRFLDTTPLGQEGWGLMRKPDGTLLANDPEFMKWASEQGRNAFGDAAFANSDVAAKHDNRRKEIERIRDTNFDLYEKEYAKEYRQIIETDLKRKK